ncbi:NADH-quinone oxidoreductase subunit G [Moellerella wisconsensis]|nr:NADH-quinone oxidoreductase subunit G [Moellerella wisconsensis]
MSCMTPAADGTFISIDDEEAKMFRESVVEWLMTNHPHDCPVCEEGGNCHLQDMTVMTGHTMRNIVLPNVHILIRISAHSLVMK